MASPATLLSCQTLRKSVRARPLFDGITFGIEERNRIGLIGPNGSGKSTLLRILAGLDTPDGGSVSTRRGLRIGYVPQEEDLPPDATVEETLRASLAQEPIDDGERERRVEAMVARMGFADPAQQVSALSGGWRKRLTIARAAITEPDLLLLDEPTNHLDLDGVLWLEEYLQGANFACLLVSHDRLFLENTVRRMIDLNPAYATGFLSIEGTYVDFLTKREEYLQSQATQQAGLSSVVRREIAWLRRGAQARSTKAKGRIDQAGKLIGDLAELKQRNELAGNQVSGLGFSASGRQTKEMVTLQGVSKSLGGRLLLNNLDLVLSPRRRLGIVGPNGSGKTTLLRLLAGDLEADSGVVKQAPGLRVVWFEQDRSTLNKESTLRDALCPVGDTVQYGSSTMHVSGWAKRFLFRNEQLNQQVGYLSGGEQARVLIAQLMLRPADLLILDEPTNDLDIPTLEVLEESLLEFPGALVLVTHDRFLLDTVSTEILGLPGNGEAHLLSGYEQWETLRARQKAESIAPAVGKAGALPTRAVAAAAPPIVAERKAPLSASERRELARMEEKIGEAEDKVARLDASLIDPAVAANALRLQETWDALEAARAEVTALYVRWEELEARAT